MTKGILQSEDAHALATDPELINLLDVSLGLALAIAAEWWYWLAQKFGWKK